MAGIFWSAEPDEPKRVPFRINATAKQIDIGVMREWISMPVSANDDLESIKGIGEANAKILRANGIKTTTALVGQFLKCKTSKDMTAQEIANAFYWHLQDIGITAFRGVIVRYIGNKANLMSPGIFRERDLDEE